MSSTITFVLTSIQVTASLLGMATNGFIAGANLWDWKHCIALTTADYFIFRVALSNLFLQLWSGLNWFCDLFWHFDYFCHVSYVLKMISTHCSILLTGILCTFYCCRIVMFKHWLLQFYQRYLLKNYRQIIPRCVLLCFLLAAPLFSTKKGQLSTSANCSSVYCPNASSQDYYATYRVLLLFVGYTLPLLLTLTSVGLIITSLTKHMMQMKETMKTRHRAHIDVHLRASYTVFSILLLFIVRFISSIIILIDLFPEHDLRLTVCQLISTLYAPIISIVLIRGNSKLRRVAGEIMRRVVRVLRSRSSIEEETKADIIQLRG